MEDEICRRPRSVIGGGTGAKALVREGCGVQKRSSSDGSAAYNPFLMASMARPWPVVLVLSRLARDTIKKTRQAESSSGTSDVKASCCAKVPRERH